MLRTVIASSNVQGHPRLPTFPAATGSRDSVAILVCSRSAAASKFLHGGLRHSGAPGLARSCRRIQDACLPRPERPGKAHD